jgi:hypothetical protein
MSISAVGHLPFAVMKSLCRWLCGIAVVVASATALAQSVPTRSPQETLLAFFAGEDPRTVPTYYNDPFRWSATQALEKVRGMNARVVVAETPNPFSGEERVYSVEVTIDGRTRMWYGFFVEHVLLAVRTTAIMDDEIDALLAVQGRSPGQEQRLADLLLYSGPDDVLENHLRAMLPVLERAVTAARTMPNGTLESDEAFRQGFGRVSVFSQKDGSTSIYVGGAENDAIMIGYRWIRPPELRSGSPQVYVGRLAQDWIWWKDAG